MLDCNANVVKCRHQFDDIQYVNCTVPDIGNQMGYV